MTCVRWCVDGTGHPGAIDMFDQHCRSTVHRVESTLGGGRGGDQSATAAAGLYLQAEQAPGEASTYVLGVELGGSEQWIRLHAADLRTLVTAARTLLSQATPA